MARRLKKISLLVLFLCTLPTSPWAARLELRQTATQLSDLAIMVGDEVDIELWVDSENEEISGATIFLSFDENVFALVDQDRDPATGGYQPFAVGSFLRNGEIFRNDLLDPTDPAASVSGTQLDYSIVRALDQGAGVVASFRLRAITPVRSSEIRIDESGIRETRIFLPDGGHRAFHFITPMHLTVQGITINGLPEQLVLARGQIDSTSFHLGDYIFDPVYGPDDIEWTVSSPKELLLAGDPSGGMVHIIAPTDASPWERLVFTATNPDGQSVTASTDVFVNAPPVLPDVLPAIALSEDNVYELVLDALVDDPDTPVGQLQWHADSDTNLAVTLTGPPHVARFTPAKDWYGSAQVRLMVSDNYDFADTTLVTVEVAPSNDAPRLLIAPNIRLTRSKLDSSLTLATLFSDAEESIEQLDLSWSTSDHISIELRHGRLVLNSLDGWLGTEEIELRVTDSEGLSATSPLTVTIVPSLAPVLQIMPTRHGLATGSKSIVDLIGLVVDPDNVDDELSWHIDGQQNLNAQASGHSILIESPVDFVGVEILTLTVSDPSGETASFELMVFSALTSGVPIIAPLPTIEVPIDGINTSIDLDDYVFDLDHAPESLDWFPPERDDLALRIDPTTHILTVAPTPTAIAGPVEIQLRVFDFDANEASQTLLIRIVGTGLTPSIALEAIPPFSFTNDVNHLLALDAYVRGEVAPDQVQWLVEGLQNLFVFIDPATRQATITANPDWTGSEEITFVAVFGDQVLRQTVRIEVLSATADPTPLGRLEPLPSLQLAAGAFDRSIVLDDFVEGIDPTTLNWEWSGAEHSQVAVDGEHRIFIVADADWSGIEILQFTGRDALGNILQGELILQIVAPAPVLTLRDVTEVALFSGQNEIHVPLDGLVEGADDPSTLTWDVEGAQVISVVYNNAEESLVLSTDSPLTSSGFITLTVHDQEGNEASGHIFAQVHAIDGSVGVVSPDFRLAIMPNAIQPDYLDLFVLADSSATHPPLLRLQEGEWSDLTLQESAPGIWHANHVLQMGMEGEIDFLALTMAPDQTVLKSIFTLGVGTAQPTSAKRIGTATLSAFLPAHSFAAAAVVALIPTRLSATGPELVPLSSAYILHSALPYQGQGGHISADLTTLQTTDHAALYRWNAAKNKWDFAGATLQNNQLQAPLRAMGTYAVLADATPPHLEEVEENGAEWLFSWSDQGSGVGAIELTLDQEPLPVSSYTWDGTHLHLSTHALPSGQLAIEVKDRAGNVTSLSKTVVAGSAPATSLLGQNYPNPFNPSTIIPLFVPTGASPHVQLDIFNATGQRIRQLVDRALSPGAHKLVWDAHDEAGQPVSSGLYFYRLQMGSTIKTHKMTLMR